MPLMRPPQPGRGIYTRDSTTYLDDGSGEVMIAEEHVAEAIACEWQMAWQAPQLAHAAELVEAVRDEHPREFAEEAAAVQEEHAEAEAAMVIEPTQTEAEKPVEVSSVDTSERVRERDRPLQPPYRTHPRR